MAGIAVKVGKSIVAGVKAARRVNNAVDAGRSYWRHSTTFDGVRVFQRNDLINPNLIDASGRSNLLRMQRGLAPLGPDGKSLNLHHMLQSSRAGIAEMTETFHKLNHRAIHINPNSIPSGIDRSVFNSWRRNYWINRATDFY